MPSKHLCTPRTILILKWHILFPCNVLFIFLIQLFFLFPFRDAKPQVYDHLGSLSLTPDKLKDILYDKDIKRTR